MVTRQSTSPNNSNTSPSNPGIPSQRFPKSFQFPKTSTSKGYSPPARVPYAPGSPQLPIKPDSSLSSVAQQPSSGAFLYPQVPPTSHPYPPPNVSMPYPPLTKGTTPFQPKSKSGIPYSSPNVIPYPPMPPQSTPYPHSPQTRYPATTPGSVLYQPTSTQYQVIPPASSQRGQRPAFLDRQGPTTHSVGPPSIQLPPGCRISSLVKSPTSPSSQRLPISPQTLAATQTPQQLSPDTKLMQVSFSRGLRMDQQANTENPPVTQPPVTQSSRAEHQPIVHSSHGQKVRAYNETESYTTRPIDRSSTSSETEQWKREVKENMPLGGEIDKAMIGKTLILTI